MFSQIRRLEVWRPIWRDRPDLVLTNLRSDLENIWSSYGSLEWRKDGAPSLSIKCPETCPEEKPATEKERASPRKKNEKCTFYVAVNDWHGKNGQKAYDGQLKKNLFEKNNWTDEGTDAVSWPHSLSDGIPLRLWSSSGVQPGLKVEAGVRGPFVGFVMVRDSCDSDSTHSASTKDEKDVYYDPRRSPVNELEQSESDESRGNRENAGAPLEQLKKAASFRAAEDKGRSEEEKPAGTNREEAEKGKDEKRVADGARKTREHERKDGKATERESSSGKKRIDDSSKETTKRDSNAPSSPFCGFFEMFDVPLINRTSSRM